MQDIFDNAANHPAGYRETDASTILAALRDTDARVVDVREHHEYHGELGHLPGSELVPLATLPAKALRWDRRQTIVLVCHSGGRSARAAGLLAQMGFDRVVNVAGGMLAVAALREAA